MNRTALRALIASCCVSAMSVVGFYVAQADEPAPSSPATTRYAGSWYGPDGTLHVQIAP